MNATIIQFPQGSQEWLDYRLSMRNASESAAVLGKSPWMTPYQLWLLKTRRSTVQVSAAMQHGTALEPAARAAYEAQSGQIMQPLVLKDGAYSASLDGINFDGNLLVEIKCPFKGQNSSLWQEAAKGQIPDHYLVQIQHQLMVSGAALAHFWVFDGTQGIILGVERDEEAMDAIRRGWEAFQVYLDNDTPPPLTEADTVIREDKAWQKAAGDFAAAKANSDAADTALAQAREALVALAVHPKESGAGVSVTRFWKAGNVEYKRIPALGGVNLDDFRAKPKEEVRVTSS